MRVLKRVIVVAEPVAVPAPLESPIAAPAPEPRPVALAPSLAKPRQPAIASAPRPAPRVRSSAQVTTQRNRARHASQDAETRLDQVFKTRRERGLPFLFRFQIQVSDPAQRMYLAWPGQSASVRTEDLGEARKIVRSFEKWLDAVDRVGVDAVDLRLSRAVKVREAAGVADG
jgi:hypothetical protein